MRQAATIGAVLLAICSAVALYAIAYDTRRLETRVHALEKAAERAESDIAVAKAELSNLARPEANVTGVSLALGDSFAGKWLQLLKEAAPGVNHVAVGFFGIRHKEYMRDVRSFL